MVPRRYKISAAAAVILIGFCLAWPLRRSVDPVRAAGLAPLSPVVTPAASQAAFDWPGDDRSTVIVPATPASLTMRTLEPITPTDDVRPDMAAPAGDATAGAGPNAVAASDALSDRGDLSPLEKSRAERVHVIHNGDTLSRLAKRYLGDEGRALEIFELNREQLVNPHLLPIGAELKLPAD